MEYEYETDFEDFLSSLVENDHLEGSALGITKQVIHKGVDSLSEKQKYVFNNEVIKNYESKSCNLCACEIPWSEMYQALDNGGFCGYCEHKLDKIEKE